MPYQYVREPLTAEEADRLANACETPTEQLIVWTLLDTGLRVSELFALTTKDILWQQRQLRVRGKGGPYGKKSKVRVVPMSRRVRALLEHHFALRKEFPVRPRRAQGLVKEVANRAGLTKDITPHVLRHTFAATALGDGNRDAGRKQGRDGNRDVTSIDVDLQFWYHSVSCREQRE